MEDFFSLKVWAKNMDVHYIWQNTVAENLKEPRLRECERPQGKKIWEKKEEKGLELGRGGWSGEMDSGSAGQEQGMWLTGEAGEVASILIALPFHQLHISDNMWSHREMMPLQWLVHARAWCCVGGGPAIKATTSATTSWGSHSHSYSLVNMTLIMGKLGQAASF